MTTGRHTPRNTGPRPPRDGKPSRGRTVPRGVLRVAMWLAALAAVAFTVVVVYGFIQFNHAVDHPGDGFSGWQCAAESGTCGP
ncbi:hypothetical protein ACFY1U_46100 [Streptomyces sp. NPDC001351]|uniref:hypothetical protein n=1 Tax=Streptomyces sp. NPDC001351 TaxID=3364564 RepID=UPI0036857809